MLQRWLIDVVASAVAEVESAAAVTAYPVRKGDQQRDAI